MGETRNKVTPVKVDMICDVCGQGWMRPTNAMVSLAVYPPLFPHVCDACGHTENYSKQYPCIEWEDESDSSRN